MGEPEAITDITEPASRTVGAHTFRGSYQAIRPSCSPSSPRSR
ncbi:MAG TPA: hypothetical protein VF746_14655 [Longimicrobium sp.]